MPFLPIYFSAQLNITATSPKFPDKYTSVSFIVKIRQDVIYWPRLSLR